MAEPSSFIRFATKEEIDAALRGEAVPRMSPAEKVAMTEAMTDPSPDNPYWNAIGRVARDIRAKGIKVETLMFDD